MLSKLLAILFLASLAVTKAHYHLEDINLLENYDLDSLKESLIPKSRKPRAVQEPSSEILDSEPTEKPPMDAMQMVQKKKEPRRKRTITIELVPIYCKLFKKQQILSNATLTQKCEMHLMDPSAPAMKNVKIAYLCADINDYCYNLTDVRQCTDRSIYQMCCSVCHWLQLKGIRH